MAVYKCQFFNIKELVPRAFYEHYGDTDRAWMVFDQRALRALDELRRVFGACTVNDWPFGGTNEYRGYRSPGCTVGAALSQHRFGRAFDCHFQYATAADVRQYIREEHANIAGLITRVEDNVSWLHFDTGNHYPGIRFFAP